MSLHMPQIDLKKLKGLPVLNHFSDQLDTYENRLRGIVRDLDIRSQDARAKSLKKLDAFTGQLRRTRTDVEKQVLKIVNREGKKLNNGLSHLLGYLKTVTSRETTASAAPKTKKRKTTTRKPRARKSPKQS